jgi:glycosyltransferase involved in cell wall biosynthesis
MVTPYPPLRDGLASYALQEVKSLSDAGHEVEVLSPTPSAAHHHLDLKRVRGPLALAKRLRDYDRVIVQYHPGIFLAEGSTDAHRAAMAASLAAALQAGGNVELRVHEFDVELDRRSKAEQVAVRRMWRAADRLVVHTEPEREQLAKVARLPVSRIDLAEHGASFIRRTGLDRDEARVRLGLPTDAVVFLSIGFIQPHKGFDRAVRAFAGLGAEGCRLELVGSVRVEDPGYVVYAEQLRALVTGTDGVTLHEGYISDELFDVWIVASDALVLPYRFIWSSSVCERAALYDRPVIATRVGGLEAQLPSGSRLVDDDAELAEALRSFAGLAPHGMVVEPWPETLDRDAVMAVVRTRAAARRRASIDELAAVPSAPVRRLRPLSLPEPSSARPGASFAKRLVRRLTRWEIDPIVRQLNRLQQVVIDALEEPARPAGPEGPAGGEGAAAGRARAGRTGEEPARRVP